MLQPERLGLPSFGSHAVVVTQLRDGRVYYNDPWEGRAAAAAYIDFAGAWGSPRGALLFRHVNDSVPIDPSDLATASDSVPTATASVAPAPTPTSVATATAAAPTSTPRIDLLDAETVIERSRDALRQVRTYRFASFTSDMLQSPFIEGEVDLDVGVKTYTVGEIRHYVDGSVYWQSGGQWHVDPIGQVVVEGTLRYLDTRTTKWSYEGVEERDGRSFHLIRWISRDETSWEGPPIDVSVWIDTETFLPDRSVTTWYGNRASSDILTLYSDYGATVYVQPPPEAFAPAPTPTAIITLSALDLLPTSSEFPARWNVLERRLMTRGEVATGLGFNGDTLLTEWGFLEAAYGEYELSDGSEWILAATVRFADEGGARSYFDAAEAFMQGAESAVVPVRLSVEPIGDQAVLYRLTVEGYDFYFIRVRVGAYIVEVFGGAEAGDYRVETVALARRIVTRLG